MISALHGGWAPGIHLTKMGSIINLRGMHCHVSKLTIHGTQDATAHAVHGFLFVHIYPPWFNLSPPDTKVSPDWICAILLFERLQ